jgi:transmembrane sensor
MENMNEEHDLSKWLAGEMTESELAAFEKSSGYEIYAKIKKYSAELQAPDFDEVKIYNTVVASKRQIKTVPLYTTFLRIAAILLVCLGIAFLAKSMIKTTQSAEKGQLASFSLPDDSEVVLNAGSEIHYKKWDWHNNRNLELDGEAYFKVAKGEKFEVGTKHGTVTVLGTQFDVKSRNDRFDVFCYEGRVMVKCNTTEVIITKGQSVAFSKGLQIDVPENTGSEPQWLHEKLAFHKENLTNIVEELARQYDVEIELRAAASAQLFTGVLPRTNLDEALQVLSSIYHLKPVKEKGKIILESL